MSDEAAGTGNWTFVAAPDADVDLTCVPDALAAAPPEVAEGGKLLPRRPVEGAICRVCNESPASTREHIPPRAAGNTQTSRSHAFEEWLARDESGSMTGGRVEQGGIFGFTLCEPCNRRSGRYAAEYRDWVASCARLISALDDSPQELDVLPTLKEMHIKLGPDVRPSAFARQVLASMCSVAGPWNISSNPVIRQLVLGDDGAALPPPLKLTMGMYLGPNAFLAGPSLQVNQPSQQWRWIAVIAYPPFAFELTLASDWSQPDVLCGIGNFLELEAHTRGEVELELPVLFSHTPYPGDWRNHHQIENRLDIDGSPTS
ncbi:MAG: hypothetical protein WD598_12225 [Acidimicrobiia bacterium]